MARVCKLHITGAVFFESVLDDVRLTVGPSALEAVLEEDRFGVGIDVTTGEEKRCCWRKESGSLAFFTHGSARPHAFTVTQVQEVHRNAPEIFVRCFPQCPKKGPVCPAKKSAG